MKRAQSLLFALVCMAVSSSAFAQSATPPVVRGGGVTVTIEKDRPTSPDGDPRSSAQQRSDHAAFTKCLVTMQDRAAAPMSGPLAPDPMMYCQQRLGMANADAVPDSVRAKQR